MGEKEGKGDEKEKKPAESQKEKKGDGGEKKEGGGAAKKEEGSPKVVLKVDMHCEGCASKIKRSVKGFEGVEGVTTDMASNKLTVIGKVDPWKVRDRVEAKTRKKVEIISPANPPKKDADGGKKPDADGGKKPDADGGKKPAAAAGDSKDQKKPVDKNSKPAASTVVLKIRLHCDGCIQRIKKAILKFKGVQEVSVDAQKDLVTVKGTMEANSLAPYLKEKLNRGVEIVPAATTGGGGGGGGDKKDKPAAGGGGEKKEKGGGGGGGGGEKKESGGGGGGGDGGEKKGKEGGGGGGGGKKEEAATATAAPVVMEANKMDFYGGPYAYRGEMLHAPQIFSDENPNACSVM